MSRLRFLRSCMSCRGSSGRLITDSVQHKKNSISLKRSPISQTSFLLRRSMILSKMPAFREGRGGGHARNVRSRRPPVYISRLRKAQSICRREKDHRIKFKSKYVLPYLGKNSLFYWLLSGIFFFNTKELLPAITWPSTPVFMLIWVLLLLTPFVFACDWVSGKITGLIIRKKKD